MKIVLNGLDDADKQMGRIERGLKALESYTGVVGTRLPYGYGIEFGRHRVSGKVARRAGGANYITDAVDTVLNGADRDLSEGLNKVTAPGVWVVRRLALWGRRLARQNAPRGPRQKSHSYRLNRSLTYEVRKRGL